MMLTEEQKKIVGANMGLVGRVIQDKIHGAYQLGIYTYDDIFQIGCIGLCKAAATDKGGCFSTYAYRIIWNEICSALIYASRRSATELTIDPELMDVPDPPDLGDMEFEELSILLDAVEKEAKGVTAKGIRALRLMAEGYTSREIGEQMGGAKANHVTAWVTKARKYLKSRPEIQAYRHL